MANQTTFKEAFGILQNHAETLRNQTEPNIDDLLTIVEEAMSAYRICKQRIDAVDKALEKALTDLSSELPAASPEQEAPPVATRSMSQAGAVPGATALKPSSGFDDMDDDIPF